MSPSSPHSIEVSVTAEYLPEQSNPDARRYAFAYHVTISNTGNKAAKLLSRHWIITDGSGQVEEVRGEGVVGEQPVLAPGQQHHYSSGAVLETPVGSMRGSYQFISSDGTSFSAAIPVFTLALPRSLN
jgi:ApaG protein